MYVQLALISVLHVQVTYKVGYYVTNVMYYKQHRQSVCRPWWHFVVCLSIVLVMPSLVVQSLMCNTFSTNYVGQHSMQKCVIM